MSPQQTAGSSHLHRLGKSSDMERVLAIQRSAVSLYRRAGESVELDEAQGRERWLTYVSRSTAVVWQTDGDTVGYLFIDEDADATHVEQVTIDPAAAGQRIGARLMDVAEDNARRRGVGTVTLTTFESIPWNAPYYRRLGFSVIPEDQWSPSITNRM